MAMENKKKLRKIILNKTKDQFSMHNPKISDSNQFDLMFCYLTPDPYSDSSQIKILSIIIQLLELKM